MKYRSRWGEVANAATNVDSRSRPVSELVELRFLRQTIDEVLPRLPNNQEQVIRLIYGFNRSGLPISNVEAARVLKVTESRIRCLHCLAITKLYAKFGTALGRQLFDAL